MNEKQIQDFVNAIGGIAESTLLFYRAIVKAGATAEEAARLSQAFIAATMFGNLGPDKKPE